MRFFYDTEFIEDGSTIDLISIAIVPEEGPGHYYAISNEFRPGLASDWVKENVLAHLRYPETWISRERIAREVSSFLQDFDDDNPIELWADYGAYDHVALAQLYGPMINLPKHIPMFTHEFRQFWESRGEPDLPEQRGTQHNALDDARHLRDCFRSIIDSAFRGG